MSDILIGVTGFAQVGKDSITNYLVENYGFVRVGFADEVRRCLYILNPYIKDAEQFLRELVDEIGWEYAKKYEEVRGLLQRMGTDVGREIFGESVWIVKAESKLEGLGRVVISDVRFENEAEFVRWADFNKTAVIRASRPEILSINDHVSDKGLSSEYWDYELINDGSLEDLYKKIDQLMETI